MQIVYKSENKLSNLLGTTKDLTPANKKSGIYSIKCNDCEKTYYGQTKRSIEQRLKEHKLCIKNKEEWKSAVASHVLSEQHSMISDENLKLKKQVNDDRRLDAYEAYYIQKETEKMNLDEGNIISCLFAHIPE